MRQKVIIVGWGYTSRLSLIRALGEMGCEVVVVVQENIQYEPAFDIFSKYVSKFICYGNQHNKDELVNILLDQCKPSTGKAIIIPNNDLSVSILDKHHDVLNRYFHIPHIHHEQGSITSWMNKEKQKALARKLGLNTANSLGVIKVEDRKYEIPSGLTYPCFTKTREYVPGYKYTLYRCNNEDELRKNLDHLTTIIRNATILVEEYKEIDKEYAVVGFSDGERVVIPGIIEILHMSEGSGKGVAIQGKVTPIDGYEELVGRFSQLVREVGLEGLFDIDFYVCGGQVYFGEFNLRIGGSACAIWKLGVNLPGMLVKTLRGESIDDMATSITQTATFVNERTCLDNWYVGYYDTKKYRQLLASDISFLRDDKDPIPWKKFKRFERWMHLKRTIKKLIPWKRSE